MKKTTAVKASEMTVYDWAMVLWGPVEAMIQRKAAKEADDGSKD